MRVEDRAFVAMIMFVILIAETFIFEKDCCQSREAVNVHITFCTMAIILTIHFENNRNGSI